MMKPLEHITVVELAQYVAAPIAGRFLADWGANVIHIESAKGDANRSTGLLNKMPVEPSENPTFDNTNMNKKFICIDTKKPHGLSILKKMLETADVFITNYRENALKGMGLDFDTLKDLYPQLVFAQVLGFGEEGPAKDTPGFDYTAFGARGGLTGTVYQKGGEPINNITAFGDHITGMGLAGGICAALLAREHTGKGDKVTTTLHGTAIYTLGWGIMGTEYGSSYPKSRKSVNAPSINTYQSSDKVWMQLCGGNYNIYYPGIMRALNHPELADHPDWKDLAVVTAKGLNEEIIQFIADEFAKYTADQLMTMFLDANVPLERCYTFEDIMGDQQAWANGSLVKLEYPNGSIHTNVATPIRLASHQLEYRTSGPIGADTKEVLSGFGYSENELNAMATAGVIKM